MYFCMAMIRDRIPNHIQEQWPYGCCIRTVTNDLWIWLDKNHIKYSYAFIEETNGDLSPDTWFGFKLQEDMTRFMLTWS